MEPSSTGPPFSIESGRESPWPPLEEDLRVVPHFAHAVDLGFAAGGAGGGGNAYADAEGAPVVIDPAVYRGDGEVDLAMTELFGGFSRRFYDAYDEHRPIGVELELFDKCIKFTDADVFANGKLVAVEVLKNNAYAPMQCLALPVLHIEAMQ